MKGDSQKHKRNMIQGQIWTTYWLDYLPPLRYQNPSSRHFKCLHIIEDDEFTNFNVGIPKQMHYDNFSKTITVIPTETKSTPLICAINKTS